MENENNYIYTKDIIDKEILTDITKSNQVMMEWEKPYMEALVRELQHKGNVLEIRVFSQCDTTV